MQRTAFKGDWCVILAGYFADTTSSGMAAATEVEGTFRVNGSNKRMRELQAAFESPPRVCTPLSYRLSPLLSALRSCGVMFYSTGRTWTGKRSSIQRTTSPACSDDTSIRCLCVDFLFCVPSVPPTDAHIAQEPVIPHDMYHLVSPPTRSDAPTCR